MVEIRFELTEGDAERLKVEADRRNQSLEEFVTESIVEWLNPEGANDRRERFKLALDYVEAKNDELCERLA